LNKINLEKYIENTWSELTVSTKEDNDTHLGLPNPFIAPSAHRVEDFVFKDQFYWDTFFTIVPLIGTERHDLAVGMVDNLLFLLEKLGYVPNSNNRVHLGRSQPPLLSSMVDLVYQHDKDRSWLERAYGLLKKEYYQVWVSTEQPHLRRVYDGLSRYYHDNGTHRGAEDESGWDYTTRFEDETLNYLPIDLNSLLYKMEMDLSKFASEFGLDDEAKDWQEAANNRKEIVNRLLWNEENGLFFDYNYIKRRQSPVFSLAAYTTMFCGLAEEGQVSRLVENLSLFETEHGLATTKKTDEAIVGKQWASPNGWAPLHYLVVEGLKKYGYKQEARKIAEKWVKTVSNKYQQDGLVYEKYNVVEPSNLPTSAIYPDQYGFAWTNAVTLNFINEFST